MALPDKLANFTVLPLLYGKSTQHIIYLREHTSKPSNHIETPFPEGRTLFVVNIPPDATERELTLFFKRCGPVEHVIFQSYGWSPEAYGPLTNSGEVGEDESEDEHQEVMQAAEELLVAEDQDHSIHQHKKRKMSRTKQKSKAPPPPVLPLPQPELPLRTLHNSGSSSHIIFTDAVSISRALALGSAPSDQRTWPPATGVIAPSGFAHYTQLHKAQRPSLKDIKTHADSFVEVYEYNKTLKKQRSEYRKGEAIVDEDGFTLVTRGGAYGTTLGGDIGVASKKFMNDRSTGGQTSFGRRGKKKSTMHEKDNFYKFQIHEKKRKELVDLKVEFEKDKDKIARLRASRQFKPY